MNPALYLVRFGQRGDGYPDAPVVEEYNQKVGVDPDVRHAIGVRGSWEINNVIQAMRGRGYSDEDIKKLTGGNFLRVLKANWK